MEGNQGGGDGELLSCELPPFALEPDGLGIVQTEREAHWSVAAQWQAHSTRPRQGSAVFPIGEPLSPCPAKSTTLGGANPRRRPTPRVPKPTPATKHHLTGWLTRLNYLL